MKKTGQTPIFFHYLFMLVDFILRMKYNSNEKKWANAQKFSLGVFYGNKKRLLSTTVNCSKT